ncbi:MAG: pyruvate carboxylase [Elusimicrobia bacterium]|nr:pyruvate carboxylase [Elusimicrobiota bacterium]
MKRKKFEEFLKEIKGKKVLVANRGIPARRLMRSMRDELGAIPVLAVTDIDKTAPFITGARDILLLGKNPNAYLDLDRLIKLAKANDIDAIHPGWGFAAEDATFPEKCRDAGMIFIGPPSGPMQLLGNKVSARQLAKKIGVPIVPGTEGAVDFEEARAAAKELGFPVMLKSEGGGGGRGIYEIYSQEELEGAFEKASMLAQASFGNPKIFVEKLLTDVRHIEIQVIADQYGNAFAFDERDCTVQRNHQKLLEMTPSPWPGMTEKLREKLKEYSVKLIKEANYYSLATVEFMVDKEGQPYMIEVNTRLQVEHGITETRYGIDLVEEQTAIAFGSELRFNKKNTKPFYKAFQVRINCEDPQNNFTPNSGRITRYISPAGPGVRLDSCVTGGYDFPSVYDSAAALLITYGKTWDKVFGIMNRALNEYLVSGVKTTINFLKKIINHPVFRSGKYSTDFIAKTPELMYYQDKESEALRLARLVADISARGYNRFVELGEYRGTEDKRVGRFEPVMPDFPREDKFRSPYPRRDRKLLLEYIRDSGYIHFTDTTTRDVTQSNSGNRFRVGEDRLIGPYMDRCGFFSIENGGGAHFHVAMLANMTYPFREAREWNNFAPDTPKQILVRSTNLLGYRPQPKNLMDITGKMICENYDIVRCFDFLNHVENMRPTAEMVLNSETNIFEPAISLSWAPGFDTAHYLQVAEEILEMVADIRKILPEEAQFDIILGLKDMAGVCPPRFIGELVGELRKRYPGLILSYHRHYTDGLFIPTVGAAAAAGAHIVDTGIGASVRWYGQGDVLATAAYMEGELGLKTNLNKDMIRTTNFLLKQIMPYFDRYTAPWFKGIDHDVVNHGMPGGATSSSQEAALKQGYIHLLPYILRYLALTRQIIKYHDVTPGSQITWNTAFLAVTSAYKKGGTGRVEFMLDTFEKAINLPENEMTEELRRERLMIYCDSNDAFRDLLLGKFGRLPLGFPPDWVYESAFGNKYKSVLEKRTDESPLKTLKPVDLDEERRQLENLLKRPASEEEFVLYLNHPGDALKTIRFQEEYGDPNNLPLDVWFEGLQAGEEMRFNDSYGKPHLFYLVAISSPDDRGYSIVRYNLDGESFSSQVKVANGTALEVEEVPMAEKGNHYHVASPCTGDLWEVYVRPGSFVKKGDEIFNVTIMKQEKGVFAPVDGIVKRVLKFANYKKDKKMVPVKEGELIIELAPVPLECANCKFHIPDEIYSFCPACGKSL